MVASKEAIEKETVNSSPMVIVEGGELKITEADAKAGVKEIKNKNEKINEILLINNLHADSRYRSRHHHGVP